MPTTPSYQVRYAHITYTHDGQTRTAEVEIVSPGARVAGRITYPDGEWMDLPRDTQEYAYSHGGAEYQAVVNAVWASPEWAEARS